MHGLFLVISQTLGRRVVPFFIEKGVHYPVVLSNSKWIDLGRLVLFLCFTVIEVFFNQAALPASLALMLFAVNARRLIDWHPEHLVEKPVVKPVPRVLVPHPALSSVCRVILRRHH